MGSDPRAPDQRSAGGPLKARGSIPRLGVPFGAHADVAQLVEHHLAKVGVAGSNPVVRSTKPQVTAHARRPRLIGGRSGGRNEGTYRRNQLIDGVGGPLR